MVQPTTYELLRAEHQYLQTVYTGLLREHRTQRDGTLRPELPEGKLLEGKEQAPSYMWMMGNALVRIGNHLRNFEAAGRAASLVDAVRDSFMFRNLPAFIDARVIMEHPREELVALYRGAVAPESLEDLLHKIVK